LKNNLPPMNHLENIDKMIALYRTQSPKNAIRLMKDTIVKFIFHKREIKRLITKGFPTAANKETGENFELLQKINDVDECILRLEKAKKEIINANKESC